MATPIDMNSLQGFTAQGGHNLAIIPRNCQLEPIVWSGLSPRGGIDSDGLPTGENSQPDYYFQSEAPAGVAAPLLEDQRSEFEEVMGGALRTGLVAGTAYTGLGASGLLGAEA